MASKVKFYSSLTDRNISDNEYYHVLNVWNKFKMKGMKYYHYLYLKCDILLLANMFEKYRMNISKNYRLHSSHYLSAPGLSWDAMLKMTKIELKLIPDPDMHIFFQKGTRGGIYYISNRHCIDNNKYLKSYDVKQEWKHIYLDTNSLYGYVICKYLPTNGFKWIDPNEFNLSVNILAIVQKDAFLK